MHTDFDTPLWRKLKAHMLLRVEQRVQRLKKSKVSPEDTEFLRGQIDALEKLIALDASPSDEIETTPLP